jgi:hypothetical protein
MDMAMVKTNWRKQGMMHAQGYAIAAVSVDANAGSGVFSLPLSTVFSGVRVGVSFIRFWQVPRAAQDWPLLISIYKICAGTLYGVMYNISGDGPAATVPGVGTAKNISFYGYMEAPVMSI